MKSTILLIVSIVCLFLLSCHSGSDSSNKNIKQTADQNRLAKASREDKNGWIYLHLEGSPSDIGYQHGYLAADEIDTCIKTIAFALNHETNKDWNFYRRAAQSFIWGKLDREYKDELNGIVEGLRAKNKHYDSLDLTAYNAMEELGYYYVPSLQNALLAHSGDNKAPGNCSAFIATGHFTKEGKIVMGHNNWTSYIVGQHWNEIADIVPQHGHRILQDCIPGFIHSGDDFLETDAGILITETTITQFNLFDSTGIPEFMRARKAAQYANSIDDVINVFVTGNNGGYANDWLIGDTKTNEVARLELGLKDHRVWRSKDTAFIGSNFPSDPRLIKEETTFNVGDNTLSSNARKMRMQKLVCIDMKGKIDAETGKRIEADHYDALNRKNADDRCVICGHVDSDAHGAPEYSLPAYYPMGSVQGKVTTADLAAHMQLWAHMGHPCGEDFKSAAFYKQHPEYAWMNKYLTDMKAYAWTLFSAKKS